MSTTVVILAHSSKTNSLGRAISMALTARVQHRVRVLCIDDGPLWVGATQFPVDVEVFPRSEVHRIVNVITAIASDQGEVIVWTCKGIGWISQVAKSVATLPNCILVADFDDDDVEIMREFNQSSLANRARLTVRRQLHPRAVEKSQRTVAQLADAVTFSSSYLGKAVAERLRLSSKPWCVIPHTRLDIPPTQSSRSDRLVLAFFGTIRPHKGIDKIVEIAERLPNINIITFKQTWTPPASVKQQWTELDASTPLALAYSHVDLLLIPSDSSSPAAQRQLPAKFVDAAVASCAIMATPTHALDEYAHGRYFAVEDWKDATKILAKLSNEEIRRSGLLLRELYDNKLSPSRTADAFRTLIESAACT